MNILTCIGMFATFIVLIITFSYIFLEVRQMYRDIKGDQKWF